MIIIMSAKAIKKNLEFIGMTYNLIIDAKNMEKK